mgnify:CR=1 FL=1
MSHKKDKIRNISKTNREALKKDFIEQASNDISQKIITSKYFKDANNIGCYLSTEYEVSTDIIINSVHKKNKNLYVPKIKQGHAMDFVRMTLTSDIVKNKYGINEIDDNGSYIALERFNTVFIPFVGVDKKGFRLGYGGGYFDRALEKVKLCASKPLIVGMGYDYQILDISYGESHDMKYDIVITESRILSYK